MVGLRLFLPESRTADAARLAKAGVPEDRRSYRTKPAMAIEEIHRLRAAGARLGCVLADAGDGLSAPFRQALSARGLALAVGIPRTQKVYPADVTTIFPVSGRAASAGRGGLADRRTTLVGREDILPRQPAARRRSQASRRRRQGAMDLRAGAPADEGGAWPRPLRGPILARPAPACSHEHDRLPLPAVPPPCRGEAGKKETDVGPRPVRRRSRACRPSAPHSSRPSLGRRQPHASTVANTSASIICQSSSRTGWRCFP